jgi:exodeoxyribonuclease V alpha subunit
MSIKFECTPIRVVYSSENYKIYACDVDTIKYPHIKLNKWFNVTIVGDCGELTLNMPYDIEAEEKQDKFGWQYRIVYIKQQKPMSIDGLREFLLGCGLSDSQANEIVREYPNIIELVANNQTDKIDVSKLYNIGAYRLNVIIERIQSNFMLADIVERCGGYFSFNIIKKLFDEYGSTDKIIEQLENNPYQCLCGINRIGFKTADATLLALEIKINKDINEGKEPPFKFKNNLRVSKDRCLSALEWLLDENEVNGNTILDIKTVGNELKKLVPECFKYFIDICKTANEDENISKIIYVDLKNKWIAKSKTHIKEKMCAEMISQALHNPIKWNIEVEKYRCNGNIKLTDEQLNTLQMVCDNTISVLSGYAGSGKSASTLSLIQMLKENGKSFSLLAPTGRASKVLSGYTGCHAQTIHRLLFSMENYEGKLQCDIVIVDESSMMDLSLFYDLLTLIDFTKTKILLVGDPFQLPSVGAGNVLYDIINSHKVAVNSLNKIFRYGSSSVLTVATDVRNSTPYFNKSLGDNSYMFVETPQEIMINKVKTLYKTLLDKGYHKEDILILSAYNKGNYGTVTINNILQPIVNKNVDDETKCISIKNNGDKDSESVKYCIDDLVIQIKNNYKAKLCDKEYQLIFDKDGKCKTVFVPNGEIGIIRKIENNIVYIEFDNEIIMYDKPELVNIKLAYSISIHKSQGGSAKVIILISPKSHSFMLSANLLYVGITRSSDRVIHFGTKNTINCAIKKNATQIRHTWLKEYIIKYCEETNG